MSAGGPSLIGAVQTCTMDTADAIRLQSDRFLNPNVMVCPIWNGINLKGQQVCPDSFYTKSAGCNSAEDRVVVENNLRPKYFDLITLNAGGINANIYGNVDDHIQSVNRQKMLDQIPQKHTGNYGLEFGRYRRSTSCGIGAYENAMKQEAQTLRGQNAMNNGYQAYKNRSCSGM